LSGASRHVSHGSQTTAAIKSRRGSFTPHRELDDGQPALHSADRAICNIVRSIAEQAALLTPRQMIAELIRQTVFSLLANRRAAPALEQKNTEPYRSRIVAPLGRSRPVETECLHDQSPNSHQPSFLAWANAALASMEPIPALQNRR
jgi:hypothetical protein